jgi:hypothetical protein
VHLLARVTFHFLVDQRLFRTLQYKLTFCVIQPVLLAIFAGRLLAVQYALFGTLLIAQSFAIASIIEMQTVLHLALMPFHFKSSRLANVINDVLLCCS